MRTELEMAAAVDPDPPEETRAALESLQEQVERLIAVSNALLDLEEVRAGDTLASGEQVDLAELVTDLAERYEPKATAQGRHIETTRTATERVGAVLEGNQHWLDVALRNLVSNALALTARAPSRSAPPASNGRVQLSVSDEGPGFPPEFVGKAFDRFARAESSRSSRGTGLGLSLVQAVAEAHDGTATITGSAGPVTLDLPGSHPPAPDASVDPAASGPVSPNVHSDVVHISLTLAPYGLSGPPNTSAQGSRAVTASTLTGLGIDVLALFTLVGWLYRRRAAAPEMTMVFVTLNIGLLAALTAITAGHFPAGVGFGLFGLLSLVRLRSAAFSIKDVAYTFSALVLALVNGLPERHLAARRRPERARAGRHVAGRRLQDPHPDPGPAAHPGPGADRPPGRTGRGHPTARPRRPSPWSSKHVDYVRETTVVAVRHEVEEGWADLPTTPGPRDVEPRDLESLTPEETSRA